MKFFKKSLNSGDLQTSLGAGSEVNGQPVAGRCTIRPGDTVKCISSDLGVMGAKSFDEIDPPKGKPLSPTKFAFRRCFDELKLENVRLNPDFKAGVGQFIFNPSDAKGLAVVLATLEDESFNAAGQATGAMSSAKLKLKSARAAWAHQCKTDPNGMKKPDSPEGQYLENIARAEAVLAILKAEIVEVKKRIAAATESEKNQTDDRAERMRFKGQGTLREGRFVEMDGRPVVYNNDGLPHFADDGMALANYKELIRAHRAEVSRQQVAKAKELKRQAEA